MSTSQRKIASAKSSALHRFSSEVNDIFILGSKGSIYDSMRSQALKIYTEFRKSTNTIPVRAIDMNDIIAGAIALTEDDIGGLNYKYMMSDRAFIGFLATRSVAVIDIDAPGNTQYLVYLKDQRKSRQVRQLRIITVALLKCFGFVSTCGPPTKDEESTEAYTDMYLKNFVDLEEKRFKAAQKARKDAMYLEMGILGHKRLLNKD